MRAPTVVRHKHEWKFMINDFIGRDREPVRIESFGGRA